MGKWWNVHKPMITLETHQKLRAEVQQAFPYDGEKLSRADWDRYFNNRFEKKADLICQAIGGFRNNMLSATTYAPNLDTDIT